MFAASGGECDPKGFNVGAINIVGDEGGPVRLHRSSLGGSLGAGISTKGDVTLDRSAVEGIARSVGLSSSGGTLTLSHSEAGGRGEAGLSGGRAIVIRDSDLPLTSLGLGEGATFMMIGSSGTVAMQGAPVEIDSAIVVGNDFIGTTMGEVEFPPFDWGGVAPERCIAERNVPPVECPFGSQW